MLTNREIIDLIAKKSSNDGYLTVNLNEDTIWSMHFGWGFSAIDYTKVTLDVRVKTDMKITNNDTVYSLNLNYFEMLYAKFKFNKLKKLIKNTKIDKKKQELINYERQKNSLIDFLTNELG